MKEIKCPNDLNQFLLGEPLFTNTFPDNECEEKKFYGDCYHCFATTICKRDKQLINSVLDEIRTDIKAMFPPSGSWMYEEGHEVEHTVCEVLADVLQVIDKHKAESEEAE